MTGEHGVIRLIGEGTHKVSGGTQWVPTRGPETDSVLDRVPDVERLRISNEAAEILGRCLPPGKLKESRTGLVVGYIQSGKTMSFTTVAAMARDNGYPLVILIAGITELLLDQSRARLRSDLDLERDAYRRWYHRRSPSSEGTDVKDIKSALADWDDPNVSNDDRPTILLTVMKNWAQLSKLADVLSELLLTGVTALLIDDEADQASLNTRWRQDDESSTYFQLMRVRKALPRHTLLQYTATPQAPLLLSLADSLSPDFVSVLEPGADYVGGREFFGADGRYVHELEGEDVDPDVAEGDEPPPGLLEALKVFFLGAAAAHHLKEREPRRAMLIHPSRKVIPQARFANWVRVAADLWQRLLDLSPNDPDRQELVAQFREAREELSKTVEHMPSLDDLVPSLPRLIRRTKTEVLNASGGPRAPIEWGTAPAWILIGGQLMDRGFTIEGLSVTYMSRPTGIGNADTLQQRARFYGYKRSYLPYCRVYVEPGIRKALSRYVAHEENIRTALTKLSLTNKPLREWKRAFLLDPSLKPSRASVLSLPHTHVVYNESWFRQASPHSADEAVRFNRQLFAEVLKGRQSTVTGGSTPFQRHRRMAMPLRELMEVLLSKYVAADGQDAAGFSVALMQVAAYMDGDDRHAAEEAFLYEMRPSQLAHRGISAKGRVQPFEGRNKNYVGDDHICEPTALCVQLHLLNLHNADAPGKDVFEQVPTIAVWLPKSMATGWVVENDPSD